MRGFYPSDIHELSSKNLDYNFSERIEALQKGNTKDIIFGNPHIYLHRRPKTEYPMNILISLPPILKLISFLRQSVSLTHPSISFMELNDGITRFEDWIKCTPSQEIDFLRIFSITRNKNPKAFKTVWRLYRKKAAQIKLPPFKVARKTFMSLSDELGVKRPIGRTMIGHKDYSFSARYSDLKRPKILGKVARSQIEVLEEFQTIELFNYLMSKTQQLFPQIDTKDYRFDINPKRIYSEYKNTLDHLLKQSKVESHHSLI